MIFSNFYILGFHIFKFVFVSLFSLENGTSPETLAPHMQIKSVYQDDTQSPCSPISTTYKAL